MCFQRSVYVETWILVKKDNLAETSVFYVLYAWLDSLDLLGQHQLYRDIFLSFHLKRKILSAPTVLPFFFKLGGVWCGGQGADAILDTELSLSHVELSLSRKKAALSYAELGRKEAAPSRQDGFIVEFVFF